MEENEIKENEKMRSSPMPTDELSYPAFEAVGSHCFLDVLNIEGHTSGAIRLLFGRATLV